MEMNGFAVAFVLLDALLLLIIPRRWAPLALLLGVCYMIYGQGIRIGPFHFFIVRILIAVGIIRILVRGERIAGRINGLDWMFIAWAGWVMISSSFHHDPNEGIVFRLGLAWDVCGIYFLIRIFCRSLDDMMLLFRVTAILLVPIAGEMLFEKLTAHNLFSVLGGVPAIPFMREGSIRAQGPFRHSILAGTVGGVSLPMMVGMWRQHRREAIYGIVACLVMVLASASSGPIGSLAGGIVALLMWRYRDYMRFVRRLLVIAYIGLDCIMKAPAYYLIAQMDFVGGSSGFHRSLLIESAFHHIGEWWLGGTDYTRHWMPTGVSWSANHTDITNYYIHFGVVGGLPLMLLFIFILVKGFSYIGRSLNVSVGISSDSQFMLWSVGASLFSHAITGLSVSYFDQSFVFLYLTLAMSGSAFSAAVAQASSVERPILDRGAADSMTGSLASAWSKAGSMQR